MEGGLQDLIDERAIIAVGLRYARSLDRRDWDGLRDCFTPDASWGTEGTAVTGHAAIVAKAREALRRLDATQHMTANFEVALKGDRATMRSCYLATHMREGPRGEEHFVVGGVYDDRLARTPDGWKIEARAMTGLWSSGDPTLLGPRFSGQFAPTSP